MYLQSLVVPTLYHSLPLSISLLHPLIPMQWPFNIIFDTNMWIDMVKSQSNATAQFSIIIGTGLLLMNTNFSYNHFEQRRYANVNLQIYLAVIVY